MSDKKRKTPPRLVMPAMMRRVLIALAPAAAGGVYFFGWRALAVMAASVAAAVACEGAFLWPKGKPAHGSAVVTGALLGLILPPTIPLWMAAVGSAFAIVFAKMAFGGFGNNVFNPAMSGRCFLYLCFPVAMTAGWAAPATGAGALAGFARWSVDAVSMATPLDAFKAGQPADYAALFLGNAAGCIGETSAALILLGAARWE